MSRNSIPIPRSSNSSNWQCQILGKTSTDSILRLQFRWAKCQRYWQNRRNGVDPSSIFLPIKNPARMHLSYAPSCTINVVGLKRKGPASTPGLSPLRSQPLIVVIPQPGVPGEPSLLAGVERSGGICFCRCRCVCAQARSESRHSTPGRTGGRPSPRLSHLEGIL